MTPSLPVPISAAAVFEHVALRAAIDAVEEAYHALDRGAVAPPFAAGATVPDGTFHVKACASGPAYAPLFVAKVNSNFPGNRSCDGLPTIQGVIAVFETRNGRLQALVDSGSVTQLRTAATTAVAIRRLAREGAASAALVGCGALGRLNLQALAACGFGQVGLHDRVEARMRELAAWGREALGLDCRVVASAREAARDADVVLTCTTSSAPLLGAADVRPGTLVAAIGADNPAKSEIEASLLARARIVTDDTAQCAKGGDLRNAAPGGANVCGELADVVAGRIPRCGSDEVALFDSTGQALGDLAICRLLLETLRRRSGSPARGEARASS